MRFRRDQGSRVLHRPVTVTEMFNAYMPWAEEKGRAVGTLKTAVGRFQNHILPFYKNADMVTVFHEEHQCFLQVLKKKAISAATRNRVRALVQVLYSVAIKCRFFGGAFTSNPFQSIEKAVEESESKIKFWTKTEVDRFLEANRNSHYFSLFLLLLKTGLRIGEALGIHSDQINPVTQVITIDRQFSQAANAIVYRTKSKRSRSIYIIDEAFQLLPLCSPGPIFKKPDGSKLTTSYMEKYVFPKACEKAQVPNIGPHGTRHTFSAQFLMNGGRIWDLKEVLGHSSIETTESRYAHFDGKHAKARMKVVERKGNVLKANFG